MPRSQFLGGDSLWTVEDRAYALAWEEYKKDDCPGCGQKLSESTARESQFAYDGEIIRCHGCAHKNRAVEKFVNEGGDQSGIMYRFTVTPSTKG